MPDEKQPTEAEQFDLETEGFRKAGTDAPVVEDKKTDEPEGQKKPDADAKKDAPEAKEGDKAEADDDEKAAAKVKAEAGKDEDDDKPADDDKLTDPLAKRLQRAEAKGRRAATAETEDRVAAAEARAKAAEEALAAKNKATELGPKPKVDDFDTLEQYEEARDKWVISKHEAEQAAKTAAPDKTKEPEKKADTPAKVGNLELPLGITPEDMYAAIDDINENLPPSVAARIKDSKVVPVLPPTVMLEISDEDDKDRKAAMARWVIGHPKTMAAIAKLPARSQAAQFVRQFSESQPTAAKKKSDAPDPLKRETGAGAPGLIGTLSKAGFRDFNDELDKIEAEDRKHGRI